jgi:hypothetical protein
MPLAVARAHSYIPFGSLSDHVLVTSDLITEVGKAETEVLALDQTGSGYRELSDHRPVLAWLRWGP